MRITIVLLLPILFLLGMEHISDIPGKRKIILLCDNGKKYVEYANPDWVQKERRDSYPGYKKLKQRKKNSKDWSYATNRPGGNTKGGGTVEYYDYKPIIKEIRKFDGRVKKP